MTDSEKLYQKYKKYLRTDITNYKIDVFDKVIVLDFINKRAYHGYVIYTEGINIECFFHHFDEKSTNSVNFNKCNSSHSWADFIPVKYILKEKINKLLKI